MSGIVEEMELFVAGADQQAKGVWTQLLDTNQQVQVSGGGGSSLLGSLSRNDATTKGKSERKQVSDSPSSGRLRDLVREVTKESESTFKIPEVI